MSPEVASAARSQIYLIYNLTLIGCFYEDHPHPVAYIWCEENSELVEYPYRICLHVPEQCPPPDAPPLYRPPCQSLLMASAFQATAEATCQPDVLTEICGEMMHVVADHIDTVEAQLLKSHPVAAK